MENLKKIIVEKVTSRASFIDELTGNIDFTQTKDECIKDIHLFIDSKVYNAQKEASIVLQEKEYLTKGQAEYDEKHVSHSDYLTTVGLNYMELEERAFSYRLALSILNHIFIQIKPEDTIRKAIELYEEFNE